MKHLLVVGDGMADYPIDALNGKTPLQVANKPNMDALAYKDEAESCEPFQKICRLAPTSQTFQS